MFKRNYIILVICLMHSNTHQTEEKGSDIFLLHLFQLSS